MINQISLKHGRTAKAASIQNEADIPAALDELKIPHPSPVIVLVGGAGGMSWLEKFPTRKAVAIVASVAEQTHSAVIDGGTQAGVMLEMGKQRKLKKYSFPLIGTVHESLLSRRSSESILDPNHTHFILVPGNRWGDESGWISKIATAIAAGENSLTVLINGGEVSRQDIQYSHLEDRHTVIIRGTGRLADEITITAKGTAVDISRKSQEIAAFLHSKLS